MSNEVDLPASKRRLQLKFSERRLLLMLGDAIANFFAVLIALRIWAFVGDIHYDLGFVLTNLWWFALLEFLWFLVASANDFYDLRVVANGFRSAATLLQITLQMIVIYLVIFFLSPRDALPRLFVLYYGGVSFFLIVLWRTWRPFLIGWTSKARQVLVVGSGWPARAIIEVLKKEAREEYTVVAVVTDPSTSKEVDDTVTILQEGSLLGQVARELRVSEIVLAYSGQMPGHMFRGVLDAYEQGFAITPMPILYEQVTGRVPIEHVSEHNWNVVLPISSANLFNPYPPIKRTFDISLAVIGSFFFGIMLPLIALAIYLEAPGPIFYRQERSGKSGRTFKILKLRTMIPDAEKVSGPQWSTDNDPRITRVGKILRKTRMDEMPQLINVLRGEMSLVGPRPERPFFVEQLSEKIPFYRTRNIVKPGVTGWAQVRYGYGNTVEDSLVKLQYDLYYIRHQSLVLDILIILRTIRKVISFSGQ
jgi:exopolysaccharide biosynthesis polyprenyl glycosylphosphotransferase